MCKFLQDASFLLPYHCYFIFYQRGVSYIDSHNLRVIYVVLIFLLFTGDLATWRMYHRIMEARRRRETEKAMFESHPDAAAAAALAPTTAQDVERMVLHVKEQAEASYQQRLAIMEDAIAITSTTANTDDDYGGAEYYCDTVPTCGEDGPPSPLTSTARSPRGLMRMLDRARKISIGAENDTQGLFTMDM